jgi:hypothetical protein
MILPRPVLAQAFGLTGAALLALATPGFAANTTATQSTTKACSQQYQAAKTANTLNGEKWPQFLSRCSTAMNNTATPATVPAAKAKQASALAPCQHQLQYDQEHQDRGRLRHNSRPPDHTADLQFAIPGGKGSRHAQRPKMAGLPFELQRQHQERQ